MEYLSKQKVHTPFKYKYKYSKMEREEVNKMVNAAVSAVFNNELQK